jgi:Asp-tRNA(Asn)/Glu-tRNA(Gln) amidotransferase A subunit family amidase
MTTELHSLTALDAAAKIAAGEITSEELVRGCLDYIDSREDKVGAWISLNPDFAIAQARRADESATLGPLHGVPFGVKDVIDSGDLPTGYGSEIFDGHQPEADAACVAAMRRAGAVLMGKTVSTEFATYRPGKTRNPHNPDHTPGGSSSGSAAAVGGEMVPLAFGNQTAGSLIRPAAFCGAHAFKPTHGTVNLGGIFELMPRLDTLGYMARSVDDLAAFYDVVRGQDGFTALADGLGRAPRIGLCRTHHWTEAQGETVEAVESAAAHFAALGAEIDDCILPAHFADLAQTHSTVLCAGLARSMAEIHRNHGNRISEVLLGMLDDGAATEPKVLAGALAHADSCMMEFPTVTADFDVLLTPSAPGEAPLGHGMTGNPIFQVVWTLLQVPCVTIPWSTGPNGLPVGVQLIGRKGDDDRVLRVAKWLDARRG